MKTMSFKLFVVVFFITASFYVSLLITALPFNTNSFDCSFSKIYDVILPVDSGCFYSAVFDPTPTTSKLKQEDRKLRKIDKVNIRRSILLQYRSTFYQRFREQFNISFDELETLHRDSTRMSPHDLHAQVSYFSYLYKYLNLDSASRALSYYCDTYLKREHHEAQLQALGNFLTKEGLPLDVENCQ